MEHTIKHITTTRIDLGNGLHILAIPDDKKYYTFLLCHDKFKSVLNLYGTVSPQCPDEETVLYLASVAYNERRFDYMTMLEAETQFD